jgi:hypothetical protein
MTVTKVIIDGLFGSEIIYKEFFYSEFSLLESNFKRSFRTVELLIPVLGLKCAMYGSS